ncbi:MAG: MFS transporter [Bacteroidota bacterium]
MDAMSMGKTSNSIQWKQLWSLSALYGSIVIGWIAYQNYQPKLLEQFKFTDFNFLLAVTQAVILVITPPIAGRLGDKYRFERGHRIPIITTGISFAAMIFMAVAFTLFSNPGEIFRWILPVLIVFWLIAMSIFTSPALSTMELFTPIDKLPRAMALLTIIANLIYSIEPVIVDIIDYLGAPVTFITGGVVVFVSGYALKQNSLGLFKQNGNKERPMASIKLDTQKSQYGLIVFMGLVLGAATTVMFNLFPGVFEEKLGVLYSQVNGKILLVDMLLLSALLSWPLSNVVNRFGMENIFWVSFILIVMSISCILLLDSPWLVAGMIVLFSVTFTSLSVSSLPLAIQRSNYYEKVYCVGIFFSGVALPDGVLQAIQAF